VKIFRSVVLAAAMLTAPFITKAQVSQEKLSAATLAVYQGKQICKWNEEPGFFGSEWVWGCEFKSRFTCTATVIDSDGRGGYVGLTDGHCFQWEHEKEYYVSETIADKPVVRHIVLQKFENDDRYDFAIFTFHSHNVYPTIEVDFDGATPKVGTKITNVNYSLGLVKQFTNGEVVSDIISEPIPRMKDLKGRFLVSIGLGPGASGSAIVGENGKIVGLVEMVFPGTQMPTAAMPTGQTLKNFLEDDSAGLKNQPQAGAPPAEVEVEKEAHTNTDLRLFQLSGALAALGLVTIFAIFYKLRNHIKSAVVRLVSKLRRKKA
jgi:Trypsin-like peptidase domain